MADIAAALGCSYREMNRELHRNDSFSQKLAQARAQGMELLADELTTIAENQALDPQRAKLKSENIRWLLARRLPHAYGDRLEVKVERVDVSAALIEARQRLLRPSSDPALIEDAEVIELPAPNSTSTTDTTSVAPTNEPAFVDPFD